MHAYIFLARRRERWPDHGSRPYFRRRLATFWSARSSVSRSCAPSSTSSPIGAFSRCWNSGVNKSRLGIANAEKIKAELDKTESQRLEVIAQAHAQGSKFIEEARAAAARVQQEETNKAIAAAEQIMKKAHEAAGQDHDRMLAELKREVGNLVVQATTTVTGKILTAEDQRRLAEETSKQIAV